MFVDSSDETVCDVSVDCCSKKYRLLRYQGYVLTEPAEVKLADIMAIKEDLTTDRIIEPSCRTMLVYTQNSGIQGNTYLSTRPTTVLFPLPDAPTNAVTLPAGTTRLKFSKTTTSGLDG